MDKEKSWDQLIIRVWKACNFKCNFCNVSDNERHVKLKENIDDIVRNFHYKLKYSNLTEKEITVAISWGEPSIFQKETIFALKYIKKIFEKKRIIPHFEIQTNASNIDIYFANNLKKNGITIALVSFHTIDKKEFDETLGVPYDIYFKKIICWIENLHKVWIDVYTNTIISNQNKNTFFDTITYLEKKFNFIHIFNVWLIQPHWNSTKIIKKIYPKYENIDYIYNKSLFYLLKKWKQVVSHFFWLPACYILHKKESLEISENILFRKNFNFDYKYLINNINDKNKNHTLDCQKCIYNNVCSWIWKEYIWLQKLKPVQYKIDKFNNLKNEKNTFWYKLENKNENLKKIYDKNVRQIIIKSSLWNKEEIYKLLRESTKIWFYKISLLLDSNFLLEKDIFLTWVSNIQVKSCYIDDDFIYKLKKFSDKNSPQFRIDLDIL